MIYFSRLFSKPPFDYLQLHMEKVTACLAQLGELFHTLDQLTPEELEKISEKVSEFEHEADLIKNDIRATLPKNFLLPIDRTNFLEILHLQDDLADTAEDIASLLTLKPLVIFDAIREDFKRYIEKSFDTVWDVKEIIFNFDQLLEASFGGLTAQKTKILIDQTAYKEHETDLLKHKLLKHLFNYQDLKTPDFYLWIHIIEMIGRLAHVAEKLALRIGMMLDLR